MIMNIARSNLPSIKGLAMNNEMKLRIDIIIYKPIPGKTCALRCIPLCFLHNAASLHPADSGLRSPESESGEAPSWL